jgi:hypothetical protein
MKTKKELMVEIKWELAVGKYMPYYQEYLALGKEFCATVFSRLLHHQVCKLARRPR